MNKYQICLKGSNGEDFWGWIETKYVDESTILQQKNGNGTIKLSTDDASPTTLFALRRFAELKADQNNVIHTDLSYETLLDLMVFAVKMDIQPLKEELAEFYSFIKLSQDNQQLIDKILDDQPERKSALAIIEKVSSSADRFPEGSTVSFHWYKDGQGESKYFNPEKPYQSIAWFSKRCCALSTKEQLAFYSKVRSYFATLAFQGQQKEIPNNLKEIFNTSALPFILNTMQSKRSEKLRFLHTIMRVANQNFPKLEGRHHIRVLKITYKKPNGKDVQQVAWLPEDLLKKEHQLKTSDHRLSFLEMETTLPLNTTLIQIGATPSQGTSKQLVALLTIAPKYFSKIGVSRIEEAVTERLKDKRQKKRMSDALIEQILKSDDVDGVLSFISELESSISFGTPEQLADLLVFVTEKCSGKGQKRIEKEIVKKLKDSKTQEGMSNALCEHIEKDVVERLVGMYPDQFKPDPKLGGKHVLKKTFLSSVKYLDKYLDFEKAVQSQLEKTEHLDSILKDFENQKWVKQYYKDCLIAKAKKEIGSTNCSSEAIDVLRNKSLDLPHIRNTSVWDDFFTCIKREKELCKKAGLESYRIDLLEALSEKKAGFWISAFMQEFFPKLDKASNEYIALKALLKEWCKKKSNYHSIDSKRVKEMRKTYTIKDAQKAVAILELLIKNKKAIKEWTKGTFKYRAIKTEWIIEGWNQLYKASYTQVKNSLEPLKESSSEAKFLSKFLYIWSINQNGRYTWGDEKTTANYLEQLRETFPDLADQMKVIQFISDHLKVQNGLQTLLPDGKKSMFTLIEQIHKGLEGAIEVDLKIQILEGEDHTKFNAFMKNLIKEVSIQKKALSYDEVKKIRKDSKISEMEIFAAWRKLKNDQTLADQLKSELIDQNGKLTKRVIESLRYGAWYFEDLNKIFDLVEELQKARHLQEKEAEKLKELVAYLYQLHYTAFDRETSNECNRKKEKKKFAMKGAELELDFGKLYALNQSDPFKKLKNDDNESLKKHLTFFEEVVSEQAGFFRRLSASSTPPENKGGNKKSGWWWS